MEEKPNTPLIYGKMAAIMKDCGAISKGRRNQQQGFMFRGIDDVMNELHDIFAKNEVFILPEVTDYKTETRQTAKGGALFLVRASCKFHYVTTDGSEVCTANVGEAMDSADKAFNKAMSIALKYSLLQMLLIPTEESKDPDENTPEDTDLFLTAKQDVECSQTMESLQGIWKQYSIFQKDKRFIDLVNKRKSELQNGIG